MRVRTFAILGVLLAASPAFGQADPRAVIEKAIEAHGGAEPLDKYKAGEYEMKGRIAVVGGETDYTGKVVYQLPDKYKMTLTLHVGGEKLSLLQLANGDEVSTYLNDKEQRVTEGQRSEARQAAAIQEITQLTPLLSGNKYSLKSEPDVELDGGKAAVVVVSREGLKDVTLFFDKASGRLVRSSRKGLSPEEKEVTEESVLSDFKKVDGVLLPMTVEVTHDGKRFLTMDVTEAKLLESADPKQFEKPAKK